MSHGFMWAGRAGRADGAGGARWLSFGWLVRVSEVERLGGSAVGRLGGWAAGRLGGWVVRGRTISDAIGFVTAASDPTRSHSDYPAGGTAQKPSRCLLTGH